MDKETYSSVGPQCPHCQHQMTADEDFYYRDDFESHECPMCEKQFGVSVYTSTSWTCSPEVPD